MNNFQIVQQKKWIFIQSTNIDNSKKNLKEKDKYKLRKR